MRTIVFYNNGEIVYANHYSMPLFGQPSNVESVAWELSVLPDAALFVHERLT